MKIVWNKGKIKYPVHIYKLIDPRTGYVFYVGATKFDLKSRLSGHIYKAKKELVAPNKEYLRSLLIKDILSGGQVPEIELIRTVPLYKARKIEKLWYDFYRNSLLQSNGPFYSSKAYCREKYKANKVESAIYDYISR